MCEHGLMLVDACLMHTCNAYISADVDKAG